MTTNTFSLCFNGSTAYLHREESYRPALMTVEAWVKPTNFTNLVTWFAMDDNCREFLIHTDGKIRFDHYKGSYETFYSTDALTVGAWNHVAVSFNQTTRAIAFYLNGATSGTGSATADTTWSGTYQAFGARAGGGDRRLIGNMDEMRVWGDIRSAAEIAANYQTQEPDTDNLYYHLKCNDGTGTTATDSSGGSRDWTLSGATTPTWETDVPFGAATSGGAFLLNLI